MDVSVCAATKEDLPALVALHTSQNEFGGGRVGSTCPRGGGGRWFENPFAGGKEARFEDLTSAQRWLHGGPGMDPGLLALHHDRIYEARGVVLAAERAGAPGGTAAPR